MTRRVKGWEDESHQREGGRESRGVTHLESSDSNHALIESSWVRDRLQEGREGVYVQVARELQGVTVCCRWVSKIIYVPRVLQGVAEQGAAVCCSVLQRVAECCSVL